MKLVRWPLVLLLLAGAIGVEAPTAPLEAQEVECIAVTAEGEARNCTATEKFGQCMFEAKDSVEACREDLQPWYIAWACEVFFMLDVAVCLIQLGLPL
jgi:hypothetical protein